MAGLTGDVKLNDATFQYEILEVHTIDGEVSTGSEMEDHLEDSDKIFYRLTAPNQEEFYRWIGGPYESLDEIEQTIEDELDCSSV